MRGKSPTIALAPIFAGFKTWLSNVYQGFRHSFSPEMQGVFDRLVASEEATAQSSFSVASDKQAGNMPLDIPKWSATKEGLARGRKDQPGKRD